MGSENLEVNPVFYKMAILTSQFSLPTSHGNVIMKKLSGPQVADRGRVSQKNPAIRENRGSSVHSDYSDDLTLNDADIVELDSKNIVRQHDEKADISDYADDLTLNDADITDLEKQKLPRAESLGDLTDYADDLTLNDADIVEIDSKNILMPRDEKADITDYADDLTLNDADIRDLTAQSGLLRSLGDSSDDLTPDYPPDIKAPRTDDYNDDLSLNNADILDIAATGPIPVSRPRSNNLRATHPGILEIDDSPPAGDAAAFEDYTDDLSLNNADIRDLTATEEHIIDTDGAKILSDLPAEIIELMCYTENGKAETRDYESLMPEIIREAMGLAEDKDTDDGSLSGIAEKMLSDTYNPILCPADKTDFLKEQNDLIELTDISTDFIDDNEDTVVNFEKREPKESNEIIDLTDIALPLPDDNEDTVDLEEKDTLPEKDEIQTVADPAALDGNNLFLSESTEESSELTGDFNEFSGYSDEGESDLSEDIEAVADLINIVVRFPDDDTESGDKKKKDLLALLEKEISEDTDIAEDYAAYDEALEESGEEAGEETYPEYENDRIDIPRAENENSESCDTADTGAEKVSENNSLNVTDFYSIEETDIVMEKDLIDLLEMEPAEKISENMPEFQGPPDSSPVFIKPVFIKNDAEIQDQPRSETVPEQTDKPQKIQRKSSDTLAEYLEDIVKDIICEKIDQMVLDQQRIVDVIEKAVLKEKIKLIRDLTADG